MSPHRRLSFLLAGALAAAGCTEETSDTRPSEKSTTRASKAADLADAPDEDPEAKYSYPPIGKRDPFRSFIVKGPNNSNSSEASGPLQKHDIDQYKLTGIVWDIDEPKALVEDPDGRGHVISLGTIIGKNWGKVTQIKPEALVITEEYRDPIENELIIHEVTMALPKLDDEETAGQKKKG